LDKLIIQKILKSLFPIYKQKHRQPLRTLKAIESQIHCRTKAQGYSLYRCPHDLSQKEVFHSCRNKGCTVCNTSKQNEWLDKQQQRLLNCEHFHLVFTLPSEYRELWLYNRKWFINTHFKVVSETLKALLHEPTSSKDKGQKHLKANTGYISVLHTWGRQLNLHPHIHCVITAGGLNKEGKWIKCNNDYLVPIRAIKALYRGKFQAHIKELILSEDVNYPNNQNQESLIVLHKKVYKKEWSINIQEKYDHANGVLNYLSRYLGASPIKPQQIIEANSRGISFHYKDHRDGKIKVLSLTTDEFMRRYLMHQAERGVHTVRYYGLYSSQNKKQHQTSEKILGLTETKQKTQEKASSLTGSESVREVFCSCCGAVMLLSAVSFRSYLSENSIIKGVSPLKSTLIPTSGVQQDVRGTDLPRLRRSTVLSL
jgi:hypothetical protein